MKSKEKKSSRKAEIYFDDRNARVHDLRNRTAIGESLGRLGAGRSIAMDSENVIFSGNGVYAEAQALGIPVRVIDSDGSELIVVRRTDLKTNDAKRKALALADNRCSDLSAFDDARVAEMFAELEEFAGASGFTDDEIAAMMENCQPAEVAADDPEAKPEIEFSEELFECHNYLVLFFDNDVDWLQAQTLFELKRVKDSNAKPGYLRTGVGRVIRGADAMNKIIKAAE